MRTWIGLARSLFVYWRPGRQRGLRRLYAPFVCAGDLVFDVGAHLGDRSAAFAAIVTFRALGGEYVPSDREGVAAAVLFWDASVAIFSLIWYVIYIIK